VAESQLGDLRNRLEEEVSRHKSTREKLENTTHTNVDLHKELNIAQSSSQSNCDLLSQLKDQLHEKEKICKKLEADVTDAVKRAKDAEHEHLALGSHVQTLQSSLKQEQSAHRSTRELMVEQAVQLRSLQRTLAAVQEQRRKAQQAQLDATGPPLSPQSTLSLQFRSHSPISSPSRQLDSGQQAVQRLITRTKLSDNSRRQIDAEERSYSSMISDDSTSGDDLLEESASVSGSALAAIRGARRPSSAITSASSGGQPGCAKDTYAKYGRRIRTQSAKSRLRAIPQSIAMDALEPATKSASEAYR
jgi:myosin heavy subunit